MSNKLRKISTCFHSRGFTKHFFLGALVTMTFLDNTVQAYQPEAVSVSIVKSDTEGSLTPGANQGGDDSFIVELVPKFDKGDNFNPILLVLPGCSEDKLIVDHPIKNLNEIVKNPNVKANLFDQKSLDPRWKICAKEKHIVLKEQQQLELEVDFIRVENEGMAVRLNGLAYVIPEELLKRTQDPDKLAELLAKQQPSADVTIEHFYRVDANKQRWSAGGYEEIFGSASDGPKETRDYDKVFETMPVNVDAYREVRQLPGDAELPSLKEMLERIGEAGSDLSDGKGRNEKSKQHVSKNVLTKGNTASVRMAGNFSHNLSGTFSTRWSADHALHSGFGFRVEAWTNETGNWNKLASDWVQSNGSWQLNVPASENYQGNHLRVLYRSYNRYYRPQNQNSDSYSWKDPDQYSISSSFNAGHRYADTDGGVYNGVGELVDAAMYMWSRLYWVAGVNPVRNDPIEFNFPNTWNNCGGSAPWSCANFAGDRIWLIASHGIEARTVTHEMAHALHSKFWDGKMAANTGGSHSLGGCYPARLGMTLTEGFANFMAAWVGYPSRNQNTGDFGSGRWELSFDPEENSGSPNCNNGWENEVWIARNFWDLHDKHGDGDDILSFNHMGAVTNLFLANGVASNGDARDMRDYENIYRNAASSGHEGYISDIFNQNRM